MKINLIRIDKILAAAVIVIAFVSQFKTVKADPVIDSELYDVDYVLYSDGIYLCGSGGIEPIGAQSPVYYIKEDGTRILSDTVRKAYPFYEGVALLCRNGKYGFIGTQGETVLPFIYDDAAPFMEGLAYFSIGGSYGFMTHDGKRAFMLDCDSVSSFQDGRAFFFRDGKYGYIDRTGAEVIAP